MGTASQMCRKQLKTIAVATEAAPLSRQSAFFHSLVKSARISEYQHYCFGSGPAEHFDQKE